MSEKRLFDQLRPAFYKLGIIADYVVEQGDNDGWTYVKWNSGRLELGRTYFLGQTTLSTQVNSNVRASGTWRWEVPSIFISGYLIAQAVGNDSNSGLSAEIISQNSESITMRLIKDASSSLVIQNTKVAVTLVAGRWK